MTDCVIGLERDESTCGSPAKGEPVDTIGTEETPCIERVGSCREETRSPSVWGKVVPVTNDGIGIFRILGRMRQGLKGIEDLVGYDCGEKFFSGLVGEGKYGSNDNKTKQ
jgi:hypothetical protein